MEETISELITKEVEMYKVIKELESQKNAEYIKADLKKRKKITDGVTAKETSMKLPYSTDTCYRLAEFLTENGFLTKSKEEKTLTS